jgi:D-amino-acid dehydrogenase
MHILVIGAGVTGAATACAPRRQGHEVTVIEREAQAAQATSLANGGFLSAAHCAPWAAPGVPALAARSLFQADAPVGFKPDFSLRQLRWLWAMLRQCNAGSFARNRERMVRLGQYSRKCLDEVQQHTGVRCERRDAGSLLIFREADRATAAQGHERVLQGMGFDARWLGRDEVLALEPALSAASAPIASAIHVSDDASGDCELFTRHLMDWNEAQGVRFVRSQAVSRIEVAGGRIQCLYAGEQRHAADAYVFAAGCATGPLLRRFFNVPVYPVKGYSFTVPVAREDAAPRRAVLDDGSKLAIARFDGRIRVAGVAEVAGDGLSISQRRCAQLVDAFAQLYPQAADTAQARFWCGLRPMTPDGTPIIGATPIANLYLNTGQGTYGWTMACGSAALLADLISGRKPALDAASYALARGF